MDLLLFGEMADKHGMSMTDYTGLMDLLSSMQMDHKCGMKTGNYIG